MTKVQTKSQSVITSKIPIEQFVTFWGVRGTLPTPGKSTLKYGGNSSCVEVSFAGAAGISSIVFDAGSGIAYYGENALRKGQRNFHIFLSHLHYDHVIGLTRFAPLFRRDCTITFYARPPEGKNLDVVLRSLFAHPFFPVEFDSLGSRAALNLHEISNLDNITLDDIEIELYSLNHPQGALSFRTKHINGNTSVVYATDHEAGSPVDDGLIEFAKDTTLIILDSTYSDKEYQRYKGWGHSTPKQSANIAKKAKAKLFGVFHYDPACSDSYLEANHLKEARTVFSRSFLTRENHYINLAKVSSYTEMPTRLLQQVKDTES